MDVSVHFFLVRVLKTSWRFFRQTIYRSISLLGFERNICQPLLSGLV